MSDFISLSNQVELNKHKITLENLGKSEGFLGLGRKVYLTYQKNEKSHIVFGVKSLNLIERIFRFFGAFKETHKLVVKSMLSRNSFILNLSDSKFIEFQKICKKIFQLDVNFLTPPTPLTPKRDYSLLTQDGKQKLLEQLEKEKKEAENDVVDFQPTQKNIDSIKDLNLRQNQIKYLDALRTGAKDRIEALDKQITELKNSLNKSSSSSSVDD